MTRHSSSRGKPCTRLHKFAYIVCTLPIRNARVIFTLALSFDSHSHSQANRLRMQETSACAMQQVLRRARSSLEEEGRGNVGGGVGLRESAVVGHAKVAREVGGEAGREPGEQRRRWPDAEAAAAHPYRPHQINEQLRVQRAKRVQASAGMRAIGSSYSQGLDLCWWIITRPKFELFSCSVRFLCSRLCLVI